jgi:hypothetical protein
VTFDEAKSIRDRSLQALWNRRITSVLPYELSGGENGSRPWRVFGLLTEPENEGRVVWELMTWTHRGTAFLRVYREERPFEPLLAVRLERNALETVDEACRRFIEAIADRALIDAVSKDEDMNSSEPILRSASLGVESKGAFDFVTLGCGRRTNLLTESLRWNDKRIETS